MKAVIQRVSRASVTINNKKVANILHGVLILLGVEELDTQEDIDGSDVCRVYYEDKDLDRIISYCEKDTIAVAQILLRLRNEEILLDDEILSI